MAATLASPGPIPGALVGGGGSLTVPRGPVAVQVRRLLASPRVAVSGPTLPVHQGSVTEVRPAGVTRKAATVASTAGTLLARGLCRQSTGENLANHFGHGQRRTTEAPKVVEKSPRSPGRREFSPTTLTPQVVDGLKLLQPASPRGAVQAWGQVETPGITRMPARLHHGPNPMELPSEITSHRRMSHGDSISPREAQLPSSCRDASSTSPRLQSLRAQSNDAAHRRSGGVWSCLDGSLSEGEDPRRPRQKRFVPHQRSAGAARGMQLQTNSPEILEENPSGEEGSDGFPRDRRPKQKRHISRKVGDGGGGLAEGLSNLSAEDCAKVALGLKRRGRRSEGAKEYCSRSPGPWDPLPKGSVRKDGWGRFTARSPPAFPSPRVLPYGTDKDVPANKVRRFDSAPASPLPYGSDADARAPSSPPPPGALPLGLYIPEIPEVKPGPEGADGGSIKGNAVEDTADQLATRAPRRSLHSARSWQARSGGPAVPRTASADARLNRGAPLLSSEFVERQRQSSTLRGGARRLSSGGNLAPQLNRKFSDQPRTAFQARQLLSQGFKRDAAKPDAQLDEAYNKCLQSISEEIEQLQSRCFRIECEVKRTRLENGLLKVKGRPQGQEPGAAGADAVQATKD
ncbi:unnamed protein product [Symbiodinium pilosum]|uniref:Uncharacterized protein n=1 Tax=Symbiodinium pilosum TaxID=2952 RepID=A0A812ITH8_SYMPI|nr:unnamed protein product [Symbiodinium pilosum]